MKGFFPPSKLIYLSLHIFVFLGRVARILKFYSFNKFQLYNIVLSTVVIMFCFRSSDFIHLINESFYPLTKHLSSSPPPQTQPLATTFLLLKYYTESFLIPFRYFASLIRNTTLSGAWLQSMGLRRIGHE